MIGLQGWELILLTQKRANYCAGEGKLGRGGRGNPQADYTGDAARGISWNPQADYAGDEAGREFLGIRKRIMQGTKREGAGLRGG